MDGNNKKRGRKKMNLQLKRKVASFTFNQVILAEAKTKAAKNGVKASQYIEGLIEEDLKK
jgi:hypothetical protein